MRGFTNAAGFFRQGERPGKISKMTTTTVDKHGKGPAQAISKGPLSFALVVVVAPSLAKTNCVPVHMYNDLAAATANGVQLHHCEEREPPQATSQRKGQPPHQ